MIWRLLAIAAGLAAASPASAETELERGFAGALQGCENWILDPSTWIDGLDGFAADLDLGDNAGWVSAVNEEALPPRELRIANHYLRINSAANAGFILVVSDRMPMCHITGGGGVDLQPSVETVLASSDFLSRWELVQDASLPDMASTVFRNREEPALSMTVSRAPAPGQRLDRVQLLASATLDIGQ